MEKTDKMKKTMEKTEKMKKIAILV